MTTEKVSMQALSADELLEWRLEACQRFELSPRLSRWIRGNTRDEVMGDARALRNSLTRFPSTPITL